MGQQRSKLNKVIAVCCMLHWLPLWGLSLVFNLYPGWYFQPDANDYDVGLALLSFIVTVSGVSYFTARRDQIYLWFPACFLFVLYLTFAFGWVAPRYQDKLQLESGDYLVLDDHSAGAFAPGGFMTLDLYLSLGGLLLQKSTLKTFDNTYDGFIKLADGQVAVSLDTNDGELIQENYFFDELASGG
ncbi:hypothetical protein L2725_03965 [Shewanella corallii]|uniref:Uncharacterized protein n=1 Tax=Shewanella corallii TaxID=560080 RepID=A0ABT0N4C3_9GAMM|nr:hypothetical protein [Shewanella corallii]MCL2912940.1 hypothetical protein [Shewanella corallii]